MASLVKLTSLSVLIQSVSHLGNSRQLDLKGLKFSHITASMARRLDSICYSTGTDRNLNKLDFFFNIHQHRSSLTSTKTKL
jgi:hypothetical protein